MNLYTPVNSLVTKLKILKEMFLSKGHISFFSNLKLNQNLVQLVNKRRYFVGSSCRSASIVIITSPEAYLKPSERAADFPKFLKKLINFTLWSCLIILWIICFDSSEEPSSMNTNSYSLYILIESVIWRYNSLKEPSSLKTGIIIDIFTLN